MYRPPDIDNFGDFWNYYRSKWIGLPGPFVAEKLRPGSFLPSDTRPFVPVTPIETGGSETKIVLATYLPSTGLATTESFIVSYKELLQHAQFGQPQVGMIQYGSTAAFYEKGSPRVAHRGLANPRRTDFHVINGFAVRHEVLAPGTLVWECFNPTFVSLQEAVRSLNALTRSACAIGPDWAISGNDGLLTVWFRTYAVGQIQGTSVTVFPERHAEGELLAMENLLPAGWDIRMPS